MCQEIMWVNSKEEVELVFDWGDKNIEQYIPQKQESYSVSTTDMIESLEEQEEDCVCFDALMLQKIHVWFQILRAY